MQIHGCQLLSGDVHLGGIDRRVEVRWQPQPRCGCGRPDQIDNLACHFASVGSEKLFIRRFSWELSLLLPWPIRPRSSCRALQLRSATAIAHMSPAKNIAQKCVSSRNTKIAGGPFLAIRKTQMPSSHLLPMKIKVPGRRIEPKNPTCKTLTATLPTRKSPAISISFASHCEIVNAIDLYYFGRARSIFSPNLR